MVASTAALNPYHPAIAFDSGPVAWVVCHPNAPLEVTQVKRKILYRELSLSGLLETTIRWDARGPIEFVQVGRQRLRNTRGRRALASFEFAIPTHCGPIPGSIDVQVAWLFCTRGFRLTIAHNVIYAEGVYCK